MAAREQQRQALVADLGEALGNGIDRLVGLVGLAQLLELLLGGALAPQPVDRAVARDRVQPRRRRLRRAVARPPLERERERLLERVLGQLEVAQPADERGEHARAVLAERLLDGAGRRVRVAGGHRPTLREPRGNHRRRTRVTNL